MIRWYAVHTHARSEQKALGHLRLQGYEAYLPRYMKRRRHARRIDWIAAPLFPRYLFVRLDVDETIWSPVRSTVGVSHLVCNGGIPVPVPEGIVEDMQAQADAQGLAPLGALHSFRRGERVEIEDGPLSGQTALFEAMTDDERVTVLLDLLGRQIRVRLPMDAVRASA